MPLRPKTGISAAIETPAIAVDLAFKDAYGNSIAGQSRLHIYRQAIS